MFLCMKDWLGVKENKRSFGRKKRLGIVRGRFTARLMTMSGGAASKPPAHDLGSVSFKRASLPGLSPKGDGIL